MLWPNEGQLKPLTRSEIKKNKKYTISYTDLNRNDTDIQIEHIETFKPYQLKTGSNQHDSKDEQTTIDGQLILYLLVRNSRSSALLQEEVHRKHTLTGQ